MYIDTFVAFVSEIVVCLMLFYLHLSFIALILGHLLMLLLAFVVIDDVVGSASSWLSLLSHVLALVPPVVCFVLVAVVVVVVIVVSFRCRCFWRLTVCRFFAKVVKQCRFVVIPAASNHQLSVVNERALLLKGWREWAKGRACFWFRLLILVFWFLLKTTCALSVALLPICLPRVVIIIVCLWEPWPKTLAIKTRSCWSENALWKSLKPWHLFTSWHACHEASIEGLQAKLHKLSAGTRLTNRQTFVDPRWPNIVVVFFRSSGSTNTEGKRIQEEQKQSFQTALYWLRSPSWHSLEPIILSH